MSYIDSNLVPGEQIMFRTRKSWIIFFFPLIWTLFAGYATPYMSHNPMLVKLIWAPWVVAGVFWAQVWLSYITSEFAVTNKRVMMREGILHRHANEVRLTTISQVTVDQSLLAQIMNYGTVSINTFGAFDAYTLISQPFAFQKCVNEQLDKAVNEK
jgi:uncharacterized membrane protein YdbT with pleckstrin-like domain